MERLAGRYTIVRALGRGGAGEVFEAVDEELGQRVAVKVLHPGQLGDPRRLQRLRSEIATAQRITHPAVCRVFDLDAAAGLCTMELLDGETLAARIGRGRLSIDEALPIVAQLCAGLAAAHAAGVVHRDLKPHNVMLCGERAVITDFGLAVVLEARGAEPTLDLAGTAAYAAPEQLIGGETTPAVDVYALGVTMFEMVTGRTPFTAATPLATALARVEREPPSARTLVPDLDPRWELVIRRCMARDPSARPAAATIVAALRGRRPRAPLRRLAPVAAALVVVAVAATAALVAWRGDGRGAPPVIESHAKGLLARLLRLDGAGKEMIEDVVRDREGNLYLAGHVSAGSRLARHRLAHRGDGVIAGYVAKIDRDGRLLWERVISGAGRTSVAALAVDGDRVVVAGRTSGAIDLGDGLVSLGEAGEGFVLALSAADGRTVWGRRTGPDSRAMLRAIGFAPDGSICAAGVRGGPLELGDGQRHVAEGTAPFVVSYERDGRVRWTVAGSGGNGAHMRRLVFREGVAVIAGDGNGDHELGGARWSDHPLHGGFVAALELDSGRVRWLRHMPGASAEVRGLTAEGALVVAGSFSGRIDVGDGYAFSGDEGRRGWLAELDLSTGAIRWARVTGTSGNQPQAIASLPDGRLVLVGDFTNQFSIAGRTLAADGPIDVYVALLGPRGEELGVTVIAGPASEKVRELRVDGDVLSLWGHHSGITLGALTVPAVGFTDGFYAELRFAELGLGTAR